MTLSNLESSKSILKTFPIPGSSLYKILYDQEFKQSFHARLKQGNRWVATFYKLQMLPLLGLGGQIMLLTTRGRKSKKMKDTPIGYFRIDKKIYVFSGWGNGTNWYQNMMVYPQDVSLQIGLRRYRVAPEVVEDTGEKKRLIEELTRQDPSGANTLMGWDPQVDDLERADFSVMIEKVLIVGFQPC